MASLSTLAAASTDGFNTTPILAIIGAVLVICIGWLSVVVLTQHGKNGNDQGASKTAKVAIIGLGMFAVSGIVVTLVVWMQDILKFAAK